MLHTLEERRQTACQHTLEHGSERTRDLKLTCDVKKKVLRIIKQYNFTGHMTVAQSCHGFIDNIAPTFTSCKY